MGKRSVPLSEPVAEASADEAPVAEASADEAPVAAGRSNVYVFDENIDIRRPERGITLLSFAAGVPTMVPDGWQDVVEEAGGKAV